MTLSPKGGHWVNEQRIGTVKNRRIEFEGNLEELDGASGKLLGVRTQTDAGTTYWLHSLLKADQAKIDEAPPATTNMKKTASSSGNRPRPSWTCTWRRPNRTPRDGQRPCLGAQPASLPRV